MQARLTTKPIQDVIAAIQGLDLESVKRRVMDAELGEGWSREYADSIEAAYRNYLTMLVKYPDHADSIMLSEDVDEFWHTHILQTMKYADDCQRVFGNFLHHNPHIGERTAAVEQTRATLMAKTRSLYEQEFGNAHIAEVAWAGLASKAGRSAYCDAAVRAEKTAYCDASLQPTRAGYCDASVRPSKVAYCDATVKPAYCDASVHGKAAYCDASVRPSKAAYCDASVAEVGR